MRRGSTSEASSRAAPVLAVALLSLAAVLVLAPAFARGRMLSPAGVWARTGPFPVELRERVPRGLDIMTDPVTSYVPYLRYAADHVLREGRLPLWKDSASCGAPLLGNGESALFFPTVLAAILLGAPRWIHAAVALTKLIVAGICAWRLGVRLGLGSAGSVLCGLVWAFGGLNATFLLYTPTNVLMLLPLLLLAVDRLCLRPGVGSFTCVAAVAALQQFGGHPESAFHAQSLALVVGAMRIFMLGRGAAAPSRTARGALLVGALGAGAALAAAQVLPLVEYILESDSLHTRTMRTATAVAPPLLESVVFWGLLAVAVGAYRALARARRLLLLPATIVLLATAGAVLAGLAAGLLPVFLLQLSPDWFGTAARYVGPGNYLEAASCATGAALPLAIAGLLYGLRRALIRACGAALLFGWLAGARAPWLADALAGLPLFHIAENGRLTIVSLLAVAILAGSGLQAVLGGVDDARAGRRLLLAIGAPALGAWLAVAVAARAGFGPHYDTPPAPNDRPTIDAGLIDARVAARLFPDPGPILDETDGEVPVDRPTRAICGWIRPPVAPGLVQVLYGAQSIAVPTALRIVRPAEHPGLFPEAREDGLWLLFRARLPVDDLPPGLTRVRVRVPLQGLEVRYSVPLVAPDDPGRDELPFPVRPALRHPDPHLVLSGLATLLLVLGVSRSGLRRPALGLSAGCGAASLMLFARALVPVLPIDLHYPRSSALDLVASGGPQARMLQMDRHVLPPEIPTWYGLLDVRGYDALYPRRVMQLLRAATDRPGARSSMEGLPLRADPDLRLLGIMGVRFLTDWAAAPADLPRRRHAEQDLLPRSAPFVIIENPHWLPRARFVTGVEVEADDDAALARLLDPGFDARNSVVLASGTARPPQLSAPPPVTVLVARPDEIKLWVESPAPGFVVLSDTWYPGWNARVNDEPAEILRANVAFRAVEVPAGRHAVHFRYSPPSFLIGVVIALVVVFELSVAAWIVRRGAPARPSAATRPR